MSRYNDFDIVYGDYNDYVSTRRKIFVVPDKETLTQDEIDNLIALLELSEKGGEMVSPMSVDVLDVGCKPLYINVNPNECWVPTRLDISNVLDALSGDKNET